MFRSSTSPSSADNGDATPNTRGHDGTGRTADTAPTPITVAYGDGIGPEIMAATLQILEAAGAHIAPDIIDVGADVYARGIAGGISDAAWASIRRTKVFLKAPITTPQAKGVKSLNVTLRKTLGLFANVRPVQTYDPCVPSGHPKLDVVIIRENEEGLYAGIEHRQTAEVTQCLKLISRPGCERIVRYAFEYARAHGRRRVTCMSKDNIMKITDGMFHRVFDEVAAEYPDITADHSIIDIGAGRLAAHPSRFDVIVTGNLYGDILSDIAAEISGSVGLCPSANLGEAGAMFEAIHGSAPDIAGYGIANPSGLLLAAVTMLRHIGQTAVAERVHGAWLATIEDGIHPADIYDPEHSTAKVGTREFAAAVIERLGRTPVALAHLAGDPARNTAVSPRPLAPRPRPTKQMVGMDVFLDWDEGERDPNALAETLARCGTHGLSLQMITNRGVVVWPNGKPETQRTDHWRCRFMAEGDTTTDHQALVALLESVRLAGFDFIKTETLCTFDGAPGFSVGQGQ